MLFRCFLTAVSCSEAEHACTTTAPEGVQPYEGKLDAFLPAATVQSAGGGYTLLAVADVETNGWPIQPVRRSSL